MGGGEIYIWEGWNGLKIVWKVCFWLKGRFVLGCVF